MIYKSWCAPPSNSLLFNYKGPGDKSVTNVLKLNNPVALNTIITKK